MDGKFTVHSFDRIMGNCIDKIDHNCGKTIKVVWLGVGACWGLSCTLLLQGKSEGS